MARCFVLRSPRRWCGGGGGQAWGGHLPLQPVRRQAAPLRSLTRIKLGFSYTAPRTLRVFCCEFWLDTRTIRLAVWLGGTLGLGRFCLAGGGGGCRST